VLPFFNAYESLLVLPRYPKKRGISFYEEEHIGLHSHIAYDGFAASICFLIHDTISSSTQATRPFEIRMGLGKAPSRMRRQPSFCSGRCDPRLGAKTAIVWQNGLALVGVRCVY
jgi:hypothetical protein